MIQKKWIAFSVDNELIKFDSVDEYPIHLKIPEPINEKYYFIGGTDNNNNSYSDFKTKNFKEETAIQSDNYVQKNMYKYMYLLYIYGNLCILLLIFYTYYYYIHSKKKLSIHINVKAGSLK